MERFSDLEPGSRYHNLPALVGLKVVARSGLISQRKGKGRDKYTHFRTIKRTKCKYSKEY